MPVAIEAGTSLLQGEVLTMITNFAGQIVPTAMTLVGIVVPVGLTCWAIGFGVKKGLNALKSKTGSAIG